MSTTQLVISLVYQSSDNSAKKKKKNQSSDKREIKRWVATCHGFTQNGKLVNN
jgi:hypothetical protein